MKNLLYRDTFLEINLDRMKENIENIQAYVGPGVQIAAVIKANGYGHGATDIADTLLEAGVEFLAVATLLEAIELRRSQIQKKANETSAIFVMGHTPDVYLHHAVEYNITSTIFSLEQAKLLSKIAKERDTIAKVHIKIDTGFHRLGMNNYDTMCDHIIEMSRLENLDIEGIFSHLALKNIQEDHIQYNKLTQLINTLGSKSVRFKYQHISDSIAAIKSPELNLNLVRVGAIIYGLQSEEKSFIPLQPVMSFKTKLSQIKTIKKGEGISYGYRWQAEEDTAIGTLPFGYADGYPRNMYQKGYVTIRGHRAPIIGVICMDQCMVDLSNVPKPTLDEDVIIFSDGKQGEMTVSKLASLAGTNKNEIVSRITRRVPRVYTQDNKVLATRNYLL